MGRAAISWYDRFIMPSWNIHTAHVERLLADHRADELGIADENIFLFGNYVPDIYLGFMVPDASLHIDYCLTHVARMDAIPVPDSDFFWDYYVARRAPSSPAGMSLVLGAWAHLVADRFYNGRFRTYSLTHEMPKGDEMRIRKQADFNQFGQSLRISRFVDVTPGLVDVAWGFKAYSILPDDVSRTADAANAIVRASATQQQAKGCYQILDEEWLEGVFESCNERLALWLSAWQQLSAEGNRCFAADVRAKAGLPPATPDDVNWANR